MVVSEKMLMPKTRDEFDRSLMAAFVAGCHHGHSIQNMRVFEKQAHIGAEFWVGRITRSEFESNMQGVEVSDMSKIVYKLCCDFYDISYDGFGIGFEINFPMAYATQKLAEDDSKYVFARMQKLADGQVAICLYHHNVKVAEIKWEEWWKYRCYRIKESLKDSTWLDGRADFEPCSDKFETIFAGYIAQNPARTEFLMQNLSYWVEPVISTEIVDEKR